MSAPRAPADTCADRAALAGIEVRSGHVIADTDGEGALTGRHDRRRGTPRGVPERLACDALAVSGGWNRALQLYTYPGGRLR